MRIAVAPDGPAGGLVCPLADDGAPLGPPERVDDLAVAMAERVVRREVRADPEALLEMARAAIGRLGERVTAVIHLNPVDLEAIVTDGTGRIGTLDVVADPDLPRGGCMIRTNLGAIDAGIDAQMRELLRAMLAGDGTEEAADGPVAGH
jgi:flagellar assembly protein FliH